MFSPMSEDRLFRALEKIGKALEDIAAAKQEENKRRWNGAENPSPTSEG